MKSQRESPDAKMIRCLSEENERLKIDNLSQGQKLYIAQADIKRLNLELTQLNEELTATDTAWQNAELREAALRKRIAESPAAWMAREKDSDLHFLFTVKPEWDPEYEEWLSANIEEMTLGYFSSSVIPGESCKVRIVREVE